MQQFHGYQLRFSKLAIVFFLFLAGLNSLIADETSTAQKEGLRSNDPAVFAITNAKIVVSPTITIESGTIVVRRSKIKSVGANIQPPADAKIIDATGKTVYAGFIDSYSPQDVTTDSLSKGSPYWNMNITPQLSVADQIEDAKKLHETLRESGFTARLVVPSGGIVKGTSAIVATSDAYPEKQIHKSAVAQHLRLTVSRRSGGRERYPNSPMGAVAIARQAFYDAQWFASALKAVAIDSSLEKPERNDALTALQPSLNGDQPVVIDTSNELFVMRADRFAREFGLQLIVAGNGNEYRRIDDVKSIDRSILLPINFPKPPNVDTAENAMNVSLESMMHWDIAPENPSRLEKAGINFALNTDGLEDESDFHKNLQKAIDRGLTKRTALAALTTIPAKLFRVDSLMGTVAKGKLASFTIVDGDIFDEDSEILETWVDGIRFQHKPDPYRKIAGSWSMSLNPPGGKAITTTLELESRKDRLKGSMLLSESANKVQEEETNNEKEEDEDDSIELKKLELKGAQLQFAFDTEEIGGEGMAQALLLITTNDRDEYSGYITWSNGLRQYISIKRVADKAKEEANAEEEDASPSDETKTDNESDTDSENEPSKDAKDVGKDDAKNQSLFAVNFPLGAYGVEKVATSQTTLIKNVTIWTCAEAGKIEKGYVLLENGKIKSVGSGEIKTPDNSVVIDGSGQQLTPGIIDCHSHMGSDSGINESGQAITAEVRIGDMINPDDITIYRQLAGGVTSSNILHGSANPIGGQNQVIKLRWGANEQQMKFAEAPQGIKFALGENVKRSRDPQSTRYPRTRMGVEQIIFDEFMAAKAYQQQHDRWQQTKRGLPPRVDLELKAIAEILAKERWIHCHSYRQDEILALIRTLDGLGVQIGTFQHILEGYKVADEMAEHGAMGSAFADWWAYKFEVFDAIPFAGALMHEQGVVVSFNSDDRELGRHLNHEAAKAVKYGGVTPEEALKFVTLNPAKQLRIDQYVGSIEVGKHADVVLWNGNPISPRSRCEKTWVDGIKYFDRDEDRAMHEKVKQMRLKLIQKILASGEKMRKPGEKDRDPARLWPSYDEFCRCNGKARE